MRGQGAKQNHLKHRQATVEMRDTDIVCNINGDGAVKAGPDAETGVAGEAADGELACQARDGDHDAFMILVNRYRQKAYWTSYHLIGRHEDARDVAQEAFVKVYRALGRYDPRRPFERWLRQIVVNLSIDQLRRRSYADGISIDLLPQMSSTAGGPEEASEVEEVRATVMEILDLLPTRYKVVLVLRHIDGLEGREIAGIVKCTHATVRWRLHRARQLFKEAWTARHGDG